MSLCLMHRMLTLAICKDFRKTMRLDKQIIQAHRLSKILEEDQLD